MVKSLTNVVVGLDGRNEVTGDEPGALVDELVEGMLAVRAWLAPNDWPGGVVNFGTGTGDVPGRMYEWQ